MLRNKLILIKLVKPKYNINESYVSAISINNFYWKVFEIKSKFFKHDNTILKTISVMNLKSKEKRSKI